MAHILAAHNADKDHISAQGWDLIFYPLEGARHEIFQASYTDNPSLPAKVAFSMEVHCINGENVLRLETRSEAGIEFYCTYKLPMNPTSSNTTPNATTDSSKISWKTLGHLLHFAIASGQSSVYHILLPFYLDDIDKADDRAIRMLDYAARYGRDDMVRHLLGLGAEEVFPDFEQEEQKHSCQSFGWSHETYELYLQALDDFRRIEIREEEDENGNKERVVYWNTEENNVGLLDPTFG